MYIMAVRVYADDSIVDFYKQGFCMKFDGHTLCITEDLDYRIYRKVKTEDIKAVFFRLYHPTVFNHSADNRYEKLVDVVTVHAPFDFDCYNSGICSTLRKKMIVSFLQRELVGFCEHFQVDASSFMESLQSIIDKNYVIGGISKKRIVAPDRKHSVLLRINYDIEEVTVDAILQKGRPYKTICERFLGKFRPYFGCVNNLLHNTKWATDFLVVTKANDFAGKAVEVDFSDHIKSVHEEFYP